MSAVPDRPPDCEIVETGDFTGVTLSWPAHKEDAGRPYFGALFFSVWLGFWVFGGVMAIRTTFTGGASVFMILWLSFWAVALVAVARGIRNTFLPLRPERVRLTADRFEYDPGCCPSEMRRCAELDDGKWLPVAPSRAAAADLDAVRGLELRHEANRRRLVVEVGLQRVEIGASLSAADREWLFAVLRLWLDARPASPKWARKRSA